MAFHMCVGWQANSLLLCVHQRQSLMSLTLPWANWGSHSWLFVFSHHDLSREVVDCLLPFNKSFSSGCYRAPWTVKPISIKKKSMNQTVDVWVWAFIICCFLMSQGPRLWMIGGQMLRRLEQSWNINPQKSAPATPVTKPAFYLIMVAFSRPWYITERQQQVVFPRDVIFCITALSFWAVPCVRKNPGREGKQTQAMCLGQSNAGFLSLGFIDFFKTRH